MLTLSLLLGWSILNLGRQSVGDTFSRFMTFMIFMTDEELNKLTRVRLVVGFARVNISVLIQLISEQDWMFKSFNSRQLQLATCLVRFS